MTVQLASLRTELGMDSSAYVRAANDAAAAATKAGQADEKLGDSVQKTDRKVTESAGGFERLKRSLDPLAASSAKLEAGTRTLQRALDLGKVSAEEHGRLLGSLKERYDESTIAARRAGEAQERAAQAAIAAAKQEAQQFDALRGRLEPLQAATERYAHSQTVLRNALESGKVTGLEYQALLGKLRHEHEQLEASHGRGTKAANDNAKALEVLKDKAKELSGHLGPLGEMVAALGPRGLIAAAGIAAVAVVLVEVGRKVLEAGSEFQKLQATLRTVGGSAQLAAAEFDMIKQFALDTPMSVGQVTEAFIKLKALGLDPSMEALRSYGNTAGAMGKSVQDMVEAVADATTGEFERLKEFGIKSSVEGNKVTFTFQGIKTTIANNAAEIQKYLLNIGNTKFSTGLEEQSKILSGALDNLSDNWQIFMANLAESGIIQAAAAAINALASAVASLNNTLFPSLEAQIAASRKEVETLNAELAEMRQHPEAYGPEIAAREKLIGQSQATLRALEKERDEREKLIAQSKKKAEVEVEVDKKAAAAAAKEAARRQEVADKVSIEWDEKQRLLDATKESVSAVENLNRELAGEKAVREFLGVTNSKAALQKMEGNKQLEDEAQRLRQVARDTYDLDLAIKRVTDTRKLEMKLVEDAAKAQTKYAEEVAQAAERISGDVAEKIFDSITGQGGNLIDWFKTLLKRMAIEAASANIIVPITTQVIGAAPGAFGIQQPSGAGSQSSGAGSGVMMNAAGQIVQGSGITSGFGASLNTFAASNLGFSSGAAAAPSAAFVGPMPLAGAGAPMASGTSGVFGGMTATGALGAAGIGFAAGGLVGGWLGNKTGSRAVGMGAGAASGALAGAAMGSIVPGIGTLAGAIIGGIAGLIGGGLGTATAPSNKEGNASYSLASGRTTIGGQEGKKLSEENRSAAQGAAEAYGQIARLMAGFSGQQARGNVFVAMGDRDGIQAGFDGGRANFKRDEAGIAKMTQWFVDKFTQQLGASLNTDVATAIKRIDWRNLEQALSDINFAGSFQDSLKALRNDVGLFDEVTSATKQEVATLTQQLATFRETTVRLGLNSTAAFDATRKYVEGLLGIGEVTHPLNQAEQAVKLLQIRFGEMGPLLALVGINADEAAKGLQRAIGALRDDFIGGLNREFNTLRGADWINKIDDTFAVLADRMRSAAALGGGSQEAMRNNHYAIRNILEDLSDEQLSEAASRYGGDITLIADSIKAARVVVEKAAPAVAQAVFDVAGFLGMLEREANESSKRGYINQIGDQFARMNAQLADAAKAGVGADIVLANNHRVMVNLLEGLTDPQLADAAQAFGGNIAIIANAVMASRATLGAAAPAIQQALFDVAGWLRDLGREGLELSGRGYLNQISDQFGKMTTQLGIAASVGTGSAEVLTNNHLAMVKLMETLTNDQLIDAAARFGGGIEVIAKAMIDGRAVAEAAAVAQKRASEAQEAASKAAEDAAKAAAEAAEAAVRSARDAVDRAYQQAISVQQSLADAARNTAESMRRFAGSFKEFRESLNSSDLSNGSPLTRYNAAKARFEDVSAKAATGDATAMSQLQQASQEFLAQSRSYNASSAAYSTDFAKVQTALTAAEARATTLATTAEAALAQAQQQTSILQAQLSAIQGNTVATLSVSSAVAELTRALLNQMASGGGVGTQAPGGIDLITSAYQQFLGRAPDPVGYAAQQAAVAGGATIASVVSGIANSDEAFIRAQYLALFGRVPDPAGATTWGAALAAGMTRDTMIAQLKASPEGKAHGWEEGGLVTNGTWNHDSVNAMLAGGEFVTRATAVNSNTLSTLASINRTGMTPSTDSGGTVDELRGLRDDVRVLSRISAQAGDENTAGLKALDRRLAALERRSRLADAA